MDRVLSPVSEVAVAEGTKGGATCTGATDAWALEKRQSRGGGWVLSLGPRVLGCLVVVVVPTAVGCIMLRKLCHCNSAGVRVLLAA